MNWKAGFFNLFIFVVLCFLVTTGFAVYNLICQYPTFSALMIAGALAIGLFFAGINNISI